MTDGGISARLTGPHVQEAWRGSTRKRPASGVQLHSVHGHVRVKLHGCLGGHDFASPPEIFIGYPPAAGREQELTVLVFPYSHVVINGFPDLGRQVDLPYLLPLAANPYLVMANIVGPQVASLLQACSDSEEEQEHRLLPLSRL